jgi:hypothetical protein
MLGQGVACRKRLPVKCRENIVNAKFRRLLPVKLPKDQKVARDEYGSYKIISGTDIQY